MWLSSRWQHQSRGAFCGALPFESSKVLLVSEGAALARLIAEGPAAPRDEGDTQVQGEAVDETDPTNLVFSGLVLRRMGGFLSADRESCTHGGLSFVKQGATKVTPECRVSRRKGVRGA